MKTLAILGLCGAAGASALCLCLFAQVGELRREAAALKGETISLKRETASIKREAVSSNFSVQQALKKRVQAPTAEPVELADVMDKLQRHANKLFFSGKYENWPLAAFYVEEIEETVQALAMKEVLSGQMNVSAVMPPLLLPIIEELEHAVVDQDRARFQKHYQELIFSCNSCHAASQHAFIVIEDPRTPACDNQRFEPPKVAAVGRE